MKHPRILIILFLTLTSLGTQAASISQVFDGDTVKIEDNHLRFKLRIQDIDAPERNQTHGKKARRALTQLCKNSLISYQITGLDKYGRNLGKLQCNQQDVSLYMVQNGHAWFYNRYSIDHTLFIAQQRAQQAQLGLWASQSPTPPWEWRKKHPHHFSK